MATWNRGRHILPSIRSVLQQSLHSFELLVVGDACADDTAAVIAPMLSGRVKWINLPAHGGSQSFPNNEGVAQARGDYIAYIGHDDIWARDHLAALKAAFDADPSLDVAVSGAIFHMPPGVDGPQVTGIFDDDSAKFTHFFPPSSLAHKRQVAQAIGGWRDPQAIKPPVDADFLLRAAASGCRFASTGRVSVHKFAAGHRYLSYLRQTSDEQEQVLARLDGPDYAAYVSALVESSRATGGFMAVRHGDFDRYAPGQLALESATRKGNARPPLRALDGTVIISQSPGHFALDWRAQPENGIRWAGPNPRPKILIPVASTDPAALKMVIAHDDPAALARLAIAQDGSVVAAPCGEAHEVGDHWEAVAACALSLSPDAPAVLELQLEPDQAWRRGNRGLGIGDLFIAPAAASPGPDDVPGAAYFGLRAQAASRRTEIDLGLARAEAARLRDELEALRRSSSWKITRPARRLARLLRRLRPRS